MRTILTVDTLLSHVFTSEENYNFSMVTEADIAVAESRYLLPIVGERLYERLLEGEYEELRDEYVAPMLGAWTRYIVEPRLAERCGIGHGESRVDRETMWHLRSVASALSRRLGEHLNAKSEDYAEYNPCDNILNHCSIDGNIVQIY